MFCLVTVVKTNLSLASVFLSCCCMNCKLSLLFFLQTLYVIEWPSCWSWDKILRVVGYSSVSHGQDQDSASFMNLVLENTLKDVVADMILVTSTIKCQLVLKCVLRIISPMWSNSDRNVCRAPFPMWSNSDRSVCRAPFPVWNNSDRNVCRTPFPMCLNSDRKLCQALYPSVPQQWQKSVSSIISPVWSNSDRKCSWR